MVCGTAYLMFDLFDVVDVVSLAAAAIAEAFPGSPRGGARLAPNKHACITRNPQQNRVDTHMHAAQQHKATRTHTCKQTTAVVHILQAQHYVTHTRKLRP
jgi:hypothetical protein